VLPKLEMRLAHSNYCKIEVPFSLIEVAVGFPKLYWFGREGDFNLMALEFLGENLEQVMKQQAEKSFTLPTVLGIAD